MFGTSPKTIKEQQDEIATSIQEAYTKHVSYKVRRVIPKNIMLIGRTRTGKSTIQNVLVDPRKIGAESTLYAQTRYAEFQSYIVEGSVAKLDQQPVPTHTEDTNRQVDDQETSTDLENSREGAVTVLNIIDTPGLFEHAASAEDIQDNTAILKTIETCIRREITKFHLVCFCASFESGINDQDIASLKLLVEFLGKDISKNACLIVTRCESKDQKQRDKLIKEIKNDIHFKEIEPYFQKGIHFSGALNRDNWNKAQRKTLEDQFETICEYREDLINLFSSATDPFEIKHCEFADVVQVIKERQDLLVQIEKLKQKGEHDEKLIRKLKENPCVIS
jgi:septin family protein